MKNVFYILILLSFSTPYVGQTNLVSNPSFEVYTKCPANAANITDCANWFTSWGSPDYYNACAPIPFNMPHAQYGYQNAHTGNAMTGIVTWYNPSWFANGNEIMTTQLTSPLQIGQKYFISLFINSSNNPWKRHIANNKIGARLSTVLSSTASAPPFNNFTHIKSDIIVKDTLNWFQITGSVIADSSYTYLNIGNFFDVNNTDTICGSGLYQTAWAYYYVDDICVSTDSIYSINWVGINEDFLTTNISMFPNPTSDFAFIKLPNNISIDKVIVTNTHGQNIIVKSDLTARKIDVTDIEDGLYFIEIISDSKRYRDKLVIRH